MTLTQLKATSGISIYFLGFLVIPLLQGMDWHVYNKVEKQN